jgi:hypothetical protein
MFVKRNFGTSGIKGFDHFAVKPRGTDRGFARALNSSNPSGIMLNPCKGPILATPSQVGLAELATLSRAPDAKTLL